MAVAGRKKGTPKTGGRVKGTPNKVSADMKRDVAEALKCAGGVDYLLDLAQKEPSAFVSLLRKNMVQSIEVTTDERKTIKVIDFSGGKNARLRRTSTEDA